ncbi:MAG: radical SAM family heme chaperone HemW [Ignavibacterium sp.]|nr:radical SAM family heme chaperone HemW [Ignavibacterium sp.]
MKNNCAIYIHIPFCDHKCIYCDFYSIITSDNVDNFLTSLSKEIKFFAEKYSNGREFSSIFFGGGTPSLMHSDYIKTIIGELNKNFNIYSDSEITIETNPGTVNLKKLKEFRQSGINRISIGIQSFNEDELKFLTRIHDKETAIQTVYHAVDAGFENISIDLIFNLPGQTKEKWKSNLHTVVSLPITHLSAYSLILEQGTILNKMVLDGKVKIQDEDYDAELYKSTIEFLIKSGFKQYEVSNFAKPGYECIHNKAYWEHREYLGFGTSAHSFMNGKRWWNFSSLKRYISEIENNSQAVMNEEVPTEKQLHDEYIMLALRSKGIILNEYLSRFKSDWINKNYSYFETLKIENFLKMDNNTIYLTPKGYSVCDEILKNILH